jgi:hypothetical protein
MTPSIEGTASRHAAAISGLNPIVSGRHASAGATSSRRIDHQPFVVRRLSLAASTSMGGPAVANIPRKSVRSQTRWPQALVWTVSPVGSSMATGRPCHSTACARSAAASGRSSFGEAWTIEGNACAGPMHPTSA